jgi:hypothetical protein
MPDVDLPMFDPLAKCIKCGNSIPEPEKIPEPAPSPTSKAPAKPTQKKESAAAASQPPQVPGFGIPPRPAPATVEFCNGAECTWGTDFEDIGEHMHQFCDVCGFEWLARPLDWKAP